MQEKKSRFSFHYSIINCPCASDKHNRDLGTEPFINLGYCFEEEIVNLQALSPETITHDADC